LKNYFTEGTNTQVLENNSAIHINNGSDNNQADTLNFEIRVLRTSKRHKRVPVPSKNDSLW
jgi:hypothetical protein